MAKRKIVVIDEEKCNGCGLCIPNCPEGALQIIDEKARLVSDLFCDGLGACIGHCPEGAISIEEREAEQYDELRVMQNIVQKGPKVIKAHLEHLREHNELKYLNEAEAFLRENNIDVPESIGRSPTLVGCPGARIMDFSGDVDKGDESGERPSQLRQWPLQLHLVPPAAPYYKERDVLLSADCVAYALGDFHRNFLKGKGLAIACPKLDSEQEIYTEKIVSLIDHAKINTLTVMIMEVPCCSGLLGIARSAASQASRKIPVKSVVVGINGKILKEEWLENG